MKPHFAFPLLALLAGPAVADSTLPIEEILVKAEFRENALMSTANSISVVSRQLIEDRSARHLEDILAVTPNVNFASGASRGRFFQVRGIGERSQFVDPINPSVGTTIDNIDFSGLGGAGTLFDVQQVEILRGPQGTRFGANALAGMINIISAEPTEEFEAKIHSSVGNYNSWQLGGAVSGSLSDSVQARFAAQQHKSDGYIRNDYLDRDDTNNIDEQNLKAKLHWQASENMAFEFTGLYFNIDNGYDAWSLDNNRHTLSDQPGHDRQETLGLGLKNIWSGSEAFTLETFITVTDANLEYGYDEDWTYPDICSGLACDGWQYSSTDNYQRDHLNYRVESRAISTENSKLWGHTDWVVGIYANQKDVDLQRDFFDWDLYQAATFDSNYQSQNLALYGQIDTQLNTVLSLSAGLRLENFSGDYSDSLQVSSKPGETLTGGQLTLSAQLSDSLLGYATASKGYKAGGVNGNALGRAQLNKLSPGIISFLQERLEFKAETLYNYELGLKGSYLDRRLQTRLAAFYMDRKDMQLKGWYNEGPSFVGYTDNAASGTNLGVELESHYQLSDNLALFANIGYLKTEIQDFYLFDGNTLVDQSGREQAHAPEWQFNLGADLSFANGVYARLETEGKSNFYFSDSHAAESNSYELFNAKLGYRNKHLNISLWGRNLTDRQYANRGFNFGNDPRKFYADEVYYQYGAPRTFGLDATYNF